MSEVKPESVSPLFFLDRDAPEGVDSIDILEAAESITRDPSAAICAKKARGLWRLYASSKENKSLLMNHQYIRLKDKVTGKVANVKLHLQNPFSYRGKDGKEIPGTRLSIDGLPLSVNNTDLIRSLENMGVNLRTSLMWEHIRKRDDTIHPIWITGRRYAFIDLPENPLGHKIEVGVFTGSLFYKEQGKPEFSCFRCGEKGHRQSGCTKKNNDRQHSKNFPLQTGRRPFEGACHKCGEIGHRKNECKNNTQINPNMNSNAPSDDYNEVLSSVGQQSDTSSVTCVVCDEKQLNQCICITDDDDSDTGSDASSTGMTDSDESESDNNVSMLDETLEGDGEMQDSNLANTSTVEFEIAKDDNREFITSSPVSQDITSDVNHDLLGAGMGVDKPDNQDSIYEQGSIIDTTIKSNVDPESRVSDPAGGVSAKEISVSLQLLEDPSISSGSVIAAGVESSLGQSVENGNLKNDTIDCVKNQNPKEHVKTQSKTKSKKDKKKNKKKNKKGKDETPSKKGDNLIQSTLDKNVIVSDTPLVSPPSRTEEDGRKRKYDNQVSGSGESPVHTKQKTEGSPTQTLNDGSLPNN